MDYLWTPWRYHYVSHADRMTRQGVPEKLSAWQGDFDCVFCNMIAATDYAISNAMKEEEAEQASGIVLRGESCFVCLNAYPYTSGHVMVIPYDHQSSLAALPKTTLYEVMDLAQKTERVFEGVYSPHGVNMGLNLGKAAGAGVAGHLHLHALPRWSGDTNFMTVIGEARVLPEDLSITWKRLREGFAEISPR
jgi:ATP adenylyltransferase